MNFNEILLYHKEIYPEMTPLDTAKLCYQAEFGCGHLLADIDAAEAYLNAEFASTPPSEEPLFIPLGEDHSRISLGAAKRLGLSPALVFAMFRLSAAAKCGSREGFAARMRRAMELGLVCAEDIAEAQERLPQPFGHSADYKAKYSPAYRVVSAKFAPILPLLRKIEAEIGKKSPLVVAIDGRCGAGKTTAAKLICGIFGGAIIPADDFFLPPALRTEERLNEPGGNIHYERLAELTGNIRSLPLSYQPFDCSVMRLGEPRTVENAPLVILEGSYSLHPKLGSYADIAAFVTTSPEVQLERLKARSPALLDRFRREWIPMEERYFTEFGIMDGCFIIES